MTDIKDKILAEIKSGNIRMKPRFYFVAQLCIIALIAIVGFAVSTFLVSFILFRIHESGEILLFGFGFQGIGTLAFAFPWLLLLLIFGLIVLSESLLRRFQFAYRIPVGRVFLGIVASIIALGFIVDATPLHSFFLDRADHNRLPIIGGMYEDIHKSRHDKGVFRGIVLTVSTSSLTISHDDHDRDDDDKTWIVLLPAEINTTFIHVGDRVFVAGMPNGQTIHAFGIQTMK